MENPIPRDPSCPFHGIPPLQELLSPFFNPLPPDHRSPSPPGFLLSKCCFPIFKTKAGKAKRVRTIFTSDQLARLEKEFARQQYMVGTERCLLASALHLTEEQVRSGRCGGDLQVIAGALYERNGGC